MAAITFRGIAVAGVMLVLAYAVLEVAGVGQSRPSETGSIGPTPVVSSQPTKPPSTAGSRMAGSMTADPVTRVAQGLPRQVIEPTEQWIDSIATPDSRLDEHHDATPPDLSPLSSDGQGPPRAQRLRSGLRFYR